MILKSTLVKCSYLLYTLLTLVTCLLLSPAAAQADPPARYLILPQTIAVTPQGNVFVAGNTTILKDDQIQDEKPAFLAKFDSDGELLWLKPFSADTTTTVSDLAIAADGSIYLVGSSNNPFNRRGGSYLARFDTDGQQQWLKPLTLTYATGAIVDMAFANGVAIDSENNVLVSGGHFLGHRRSPTHPHHGVLGKYDTDGKLLWDRDFAVQYDHHVAGLALDDQDYSYVAGATAPQQLGLPTDANVYVIKFDREGEEVWSHIIDTRFQNYLNSISVDGAGNVFVTHRFLASLDSDGNQRWKIELGCLGGGVASGAGRVTVVGGCPADPDDESFRLPNVFVHQYSTDGTLLWEHQFGTSQGDWSRGVAMSEAGDSYVTGYLERSQEDAEAYPPRSGGRYLFLAKYDPDGQQLWLQTIESSVVMPK